MHFGWLLPELQLTSAAQFTTSGSPHLRKELTLFRVILSVLLPIIATTPAFADCDPHDLLTYQFTVQGGETFELYSEDAPSAYLICERGPSGAEGGLIVVADGHVVPIGVYTPYPSCVEVRGKAISVQNGGGAGAPAITRLTCRPAGEDHADGSPS